MDKEYVHVSEMLLIGAGQIYPFIHQPNTSTHCSLSQMWIKLLLCLFQCFVAVVVYLLKTFCPVPKPARWSLSLEKSFETYCFSSLGLG